MQLSKSRFTAGLQCPRLLWWKVHEPMAEELQPDIVLQDRFDQGAQVGALARDRHRDGILIDLPHQAIAERLAATQRALNDGATTIFEASLKADDTFVAVDVLTRDGGAWHLTEVKSSNSVKEEHVADAAIQLHVLTRSGLDVATVAIMHLNKECKHPDLDNLFVREDITAEARAKLPDIPDQIEAQLAMLARPEPPAARIGEHCSSPYDCPFQARCWPAGRNHISKLNGVGPKKLEAYMAKGIETIDALPPNEKLSFTARRQIRSMRENRIIVEPTLTNALTPFTGRLGFLDFETIQRAVPVWPGMAPWEQAAAQFSYHELQPDGSHTHAEFLAEGPLDARPILAARMIDATRRADRVVTYSSFEKTRIRGLQQCVPDLRDELVALEGKLIDLLPVIRDCVYHPEFEGSFSIKSVLPALVPGLNYDDLVIFDGMVASVEIARLLFVAGKIRPEEKDRVRGDLLRYCERDTWAMVKLLERLRELASKGDA